MLTAVSHYGMRRFFAQMKQKRLRFGAVLIMIVPVCFILCLCLGRMSLSPAEVLKAILSRLTDSVECSAQTYTVVWSMRVRRLLTAAVTGIGLSVSGCIFQSIFSNPLATPDTLGVASGASFGAVLAMLLGMGTAGTQLMALAFGFIAVVLTELSSHGTGNHVSTTILAGIMVGSLFNALISLIKFTADTESQLPAITYWLMGSMESTGYEQLAVGGLPVMVCTLVLLLMRWRLNLLTLSEEEALSTGVNLKRLRTVAQLCATILTASCVSMCGQVGWVGLLVPHICRMCVGSNSASLLPATIGTGAVFMMLVDTFARTVSPKEIPISVLTAVLGAPFFIYLLRKKGRWGI